MKRRIIIFIIVLIVIGSLGYWVYTRSSTSAQSGGKSPTENTYTVAKMKLRETLTISGDVDADEQVTLAFQTGGRLAWVGVKEGDYVQKYQGIASLDQRSVEKNLQTSLNNFMTSRWNFDQTKQDNKDAYVKDGDIGEEMRRIIDKSQFNLNNAVISVELQSLAKEYSYLYTPIEGVVTRVDAPYAGVNIGPTTSYAVVNPQTAFFSATADQTEVTKLRVGENAIISLDAYPDEHITATVSSLSYTPKVGDTGTTYEVKLTFPENVDVLKYRLGMTGDVEFVTKEKPNVIAVPISYVRSEKGQKYVQLLVDGKPVKTEVKTGDEGDNEIEILKGLKVGDVLVEKVGN
jgi:RND family efflux transporter MFP subunit